MFSKLRSQGASAALRSAVRFYSRRRSETYKGKCGGGREGKIWRVPLEQTYYGYEDAAQYE